MKNNVTLLKIKKKIPLRYHAFSVCIKYLKYITKVNLELPLCENL